jgi:hypothetical protein
MPFRPKKFGFRTKTSDSFRKLRFHSEKPLKMVGFEQFVDKKATSPDTTSASPAPTAPPGGPSHLARRNKHCGRNDQEHYIAPNHQIDFPLMAIVSEQSATPLK